jgi:transcriptional regulator NrdR family protein
LSSKVLKSNGSEEDYSPKKLTDSIAYSLYVAGEPEATSTVITADIAKEITKLLASKTHVTSNDLRNYAAKALKSHNHHASYIYLHHKKLS